MDGWTSSGSFDEVDMIAYLLGQGLYWVWYVATEIKNDDGRATDRRMGLDP